MPNIFTPNVTQGDASVRYRLWRHGKNTFSATVHGPTFTATYTRDDCGAGCRCAAFLTPTHSLGIRILATAKRIDSQSKTIA